MRLIFALFLFVQFSVASWAVDSTSEKKIRSQLYKSKTRPTVAEVMRAYNGELPRWSHSNEDDQDYKDQQEADAQELAEMIVNLEIAFPGARYFSLGRDVVGSGDALDAFYSLVMKEPGRVGRFNASGSSFSGETDKDAKLIVGYLRTIGFDFQNIDSGPGLVLFDRTSYGDQSQSRLIMRAAYQEAKRRGHDPRRILQKLNFVSQNSRAMRPREIKEYFAKERKAVDAEGPQEIMDLLSYNREGFYWHDSWGEFRRHGRRVLTRPGQQFDKDHKSEVIDFILQQIHLVHSPVFLTALKKEFKNRRVQIEKYLNVRLIDEALERSKAREAEARERAMAELREMMKLPPIPAETRYYDDNGRRASAASDFAFSKNGWLAKKWLDNYQGLDHIGGDFLIFLLEARAQKLLGGKETRILARQAFDRDLSDRSKKTLETFFNAHPEKLEYVYAHVARANQNNERDDIIQAVQSLRLSKSCKQVLEEVDSQE